MGPQGGEGFDEQGNSLGLYGSGATDTSPTQHEQKVVEEAQRQNEARGDMTIVDLAGHGMSFGLTDEASGIGQAIAGALKGDLDIAGNYRLGRDAEQSRVDQARERYGWAGTAAELAGGMSLPAGALAQTGRVADAAKAGAIAGGVGGFGYGRGTEESLISAGVGTALGAGLGAGAQRLGNALNAPTRAATPVDAQRLARAGQAEGVTVNRAMVDPNSANRVSRVDASPSGGPRLQAGMREIEGQIEGRVGQLGQGQKPTSERVGEVSQEALDRFRSTSRDEIGLVYTKAEKLAGDTRVAPQNAIRVIDDQITELTEAGANANAGTIRYLNELKQDLGSEGGLSISAIRNLRTNMRGQINERNLTATDAERRVGMVLDAASEDMAQGLSGNPRALEAYREADGQWKERGDFIRQVMRKLTGPEDNRLSGEATARKIESWMKSDGERFNRFWQALEPGEQTEIATYVAGNLGRNRAGDFSVAQFITQTEGMSDRALRTVFGKEGYESIGNLRVISEQVKRVTGAMNSRTSKTAPASYRDVLWSWTMGGGAGAFGGVAVDASQLGTAALTMAGAGAVQGATRGNQIIQSRLLLSPKITKWLRNTPNTTNPKAIDAHFNRLGEIAKAEPAIAKEIEWLQSAIMRAANDNTLVSAGAAQDEAN